jgi:tetratricopeptide (TPR) repeat protein
MLEAYRLFFREHFLLDALHEPASTVGYTLLSRLRRLNQGLGVNDEEMEAVLDRELAALERDLPEKAAIRYLRSREAVRRGEHDLALERFARLEKDGPDRLYGRKALACRAALLYARGDLAAARGLYDRYRREHPRSPYAFVAALRRGHAFALSGKLAEAVRAYDEVRGDFAVEPLARPLASLAAGRVLEEHDALAEAAARYRQALDEWRERDLRIGTPLANLKVARSTGFDPDAPASRQDVEARIAFLDRPGMNPGALRMLHRGHRHRRDGRADEAVTSWRRLVQEHPDSPLVAETRFALAMALTDQALAAPSVAEAEPHLAALAREGGRFGTFAAALVRALVELRIVDRSAKAEPRLAAALVAWHESQTYPEPNDALERDVAAIRAATFRPDDPTFHPKLRGPRGERPPPPVTRRTYRVLDPAIDVELADGTVRTVSVRQRLPDVEGKVLYFTRAELAQIRRIVDGLGGRERRQPGSVMGIPRPEGGSKAIQELLDGQFAVRPGHWGGWHFETFPSLLRIVFSDEERTAAVVRFRYGYRGGEMTVAKTDTGWRLRDVRFTWIE